MRFSTLMQSATALLGLVLLIDRAAAQGCADDIYEPNDDCVSATPITVGPLFNLVMAAGTYTSHIGDYYAYTMAAGESVVFDVYFIDAVGDIDLQLYSDAACLTQVASAASVTDNETISYTNNTAGSLTVTMKVFPWAAPSCVYYSIHVTTQGSICGALADDAFEPNDDCASAVAVTEGTYPALAVFKNVSDDYFSVSVPDADTLTVKVLHVAASGDIDCYLYDSATLGTTCGDKLSFLVNGYTGFDNEQMVWTNTTGSTQTYFIQVNVWDNAGNENCNNYDLVIDIDSPNIATAICAGDGTDGACPCGNESTLGAGEGCKSSIGTGAILAATGSNSVAADDIVFTVTQARPNQTGMLLQGASQISTTFKDGHFCMGNPTERVEFATTDGSGTAFTVGSVVTNGNVVSGNTRYYQWWYRDPGGVSPCGTGSNFSSGLSVTYTP